MKRLLLFLLVAFVVSVFGRDLLAQDNGLPNTGPKMDPSYPEQWGHNPPISGTAGGFRAEKRVITKGPLAPSVEDRAIYANFLAQPHTGLIRLLPRQVPQPKNADVKINGGGAYYSFAFLTHEYGFGSDLELSTTYRFKGRSQSDDDSASDSKASTTASSLVRLPVWHELSVGFAGYDYGMMTRVDDVALEDITTNDARVRFMLGYRPPRTGPDARREASDFREGRLVDLQLYRSREPIQLNTTYLLRSISYGESDVLVAFCVVRQDPDASVTIAWKLLKRFDPVNLKR